MTLCPALHYFGCSARTQEHFAHAVLHVLKTGNKEGVAIVIPDM